jgi:hypothetical protein
MCQSCMAVWANGEECTPYEEIYKAIVEEDKEKVMGWRNFIIQEKKGDLGKVDLVICQILDNIFQNTFIKALKKGTVKVSQHFMGSSTEARELWADYCAEVLPALQTAQSKDQIELFHCKDCWHNILIGFCYRNKPELEYEC